MIEQGFITLVCSRVETTFSVSVLCHIQGRRNGDCLIQFSGPSVGKWVDCYALNVMLQDGGCSNRTGSG